MLRSMAEAAIRHHCRRAGRARRRQFRKRPRGVCLGRAITDKGWVRIGVCNNKILNADSILPGVVFYPVDRFTCHGKAHSTRLVIGVGCRPFDISATCSDVFDQAHETFILVVLMVAMEERRTKVISNEVDLCRRESDHVQRVLHQPRCQFVADLSHLKRVTV
jgi:hypothetical protein